jgi:hypothetical protein
MSCSDARERHRGVSHHTRTVLELLLAPVRVAVPEGELPAAAAEPPSPAERHAWSEHRADLEGYRASGLPTRSMGREDELFFAAALAAGTALAELAADMAAAGEVMP